MIEWNLILVNSLNWVPKDYKIELKQLENNLKVDIRIYSNLQSMFEMARKEGVYPVAESAYRTKEEQEAIFAERVLEYQNEGLSEEEAIKETMVFVAKPGRSEHQLGLAVDINGDLNRSTDAVVHNWLFNNSYKYGFIQRYPKDKIHITGIQYEPWHYRYVGIEVARKMYSDKLCLEEYYEQFIDYCSLRKFIH